MNYHEGQATVKSDQHEAENNENVFDPFSHVISPRSPVGNERNAASNARSPVGNERNAASNARIPVGNERSPTGSSRNPDSSKQEGSLSSYLRCPQELRHNVCHVCREIQMRIHRSITIRGIPRLFLLRRLFCLYWMIVVAFLVYLKLYFPLYLISTVSRNTLEEFRSDWCRLRNARVNWRFLVSACESNIKWTSHLAGWSIGNKTDPNFSYISLMNINSAGEFSTISIQSQTSSGQPKTIGGDSWRIHINGPSALAPTVIDHNNGTYEALFLVMEPGTYRVYIHLDYTLCQGYKDPPDYWFVMGNVHGSHQKHGILGSEHHYLNQPLWQGTPLIIHVPQAQGPLRKDEFLSYRSVSCEENCNLFWDGYGRWTNGTWAPYVTESSVRSPIARRREGVLWIYGDSNAVRFYKSIKHRSHLCSLIFKQCNFTYNWVYNIHNSTIEKSKQDFLDMDHERVMRELKTVLYRPEMNNSKSVIVLNFGLHFISSIDFTSYKRLINRTIEVLGERDEENGILRRRYQGNVVWKSTSAINRERLEDPYYQGRRFMTQQRIILFNAYASWSMCRAGIKVLDVYPISNSYPGGTGTRYNSYDAVHYKGSVFDSVITLLERFYGDVDF